MSPASSGAPGYPVVEGGHQLMVAAPDAWWPEATVISADRYAGRRYRCPSCNAEVWTAFGRARMHREGHARRLLEAAGYVVLSPAEAAPRPR